MVAELILFLQLFIVRRFIYCDAFHTNVSSFSVTVVHCCVVLGHWVTGSVGHSSHLSRPGHRVCAADDRPFFCPPLMTCDTEAQIHRQSASYCMQ